MTIKATIGDQQNIPAVVRSTGSQVKVSGVGIQGPSATDTLQSAKLRQIGDVDSTNLVNGSLLVYNPNTEKWVTQTLLDQQTMDGGAF